MASTVTSQSCPMVHKGEARLWDPVELWRTRWPKDSCAHSQPEWSPHILDAVLPYYLSLQDSDTGVAQASQGQQVYLHCTDVDLAHLSTLHPAEANRLVYTAQMQDQQGLSTLMNAVPVHNWLSQGSGMM